MKQQTITAQSCGMLLILSMLTDFILSPPMLSGTAQSAILAVLLFTAFLSLILPLFLRVLLPNHKNCALYAIVFFFAAAQALVQVQRFYTAVSDVPLAQSIIFALLLIAALFAVSNGFAAIGRVTQLVFLLFLLSALFLLLGNFMDFHITNLTFTQNLPQKTFADTLQLCSIPTEILLFCTMCHAQGSEKKQALQKAIWTIGGMLALLLLCAELRLGTSHSQTNMPFYALARMGGISVFKRMDTLHVCVWLFAAMVRIVSLLSGAKTMLTQCLPQKSSAMILVLTGFLVTVFACVVSALPRSVQKGSLSVMLILLFCIALCGEKRRKTPCVNNE